MKTIFTVFGFLLFIIAGAQPAGYNFGKHIAINSTEVSGTSDLLDFTILVSTTDNDLRTVANGGHVENANGFDIIFTLGDCNTLLNHQLEKYDPVTGELIAWVRIPAVSGVTNTNFHMYYGNAGVATDPSTTATWDTDYEGVWHMNNDPSSSMLIDYSGDGINGASHGSMTSSDLVSGKIGDAIDFDGSNDYFSLASKNYNTTSAIPTMTVSAWVRTNYSSGGNHHNWSILDYDRSEYYNIFISGNGRLCFASSRPGSTFNDSYAGTAGDLNDNNWHHIAGVYDGTDKLLYIDGVLVFTQSNPHGGLGFGTGTTRFGFIGEGSEANSYNGSRNNIYYDGQYDEIRFTTDALSSDWIATEFNNMDDPASFLTIGAELSAGDLCTLLPIELYAFTATPKNSQVQLDWTTLSERNNAFFTIEHSIDGKNDWEVITKLDGAGNSSTLLNYQTMHTNPVNGLNYYRLKQTDFNGAYEYFETVSVTLNEFDKLNAYPNPTDGQITLVSKYAIEAEEIQITDLMGRIVSDAVTINNQSENTLTLDISKLPTGLYVLTSRYGVIRIEKI